MEICSIYLLWQITYFMNRFKQISLGIVPGSTIIYFKVFRAYVRYDTDDFMSSSIPSANS